MTDEEICAILDKMRADEPDHENCAMRIKKEKEKLEAMRRDTATAEDKSKGAGN